MRYYIIHTEGKIIECLRTDNKFSRYGDLKTFETFEKAQNWLIRHKCFNKWGNLYIIKECNEV